MSERKSRLTAERTHRAIGRWYWMRRQDCPRKPVITVHPEDYDHMIKSGPREIVNMLLADYEVVSDRRIDRDIMELS